MKMTVKLFGTLRSRYPGYDKECGIVLEPDAQMTVKEVIDHLDLPEKQVGIVTIDGKLSKAGDMVPDGSMVKVFQPLAGG